MVKPVSSTPRRRLKSSTQTNEDQLASTLSFSMPSTKIRLSNHSIVIERKVDFNFFEREKFFIYGKIRNFGWQYFCSLNELVYPSLVLEFYENTSLEPDSLVSKVKETILYISIILLCQLFRLPCVDESSSPPFSRRNAWVYILGRADVEDIKDLFVNQLSLELHLLHSFVCKIFMLRMENFDYVMEKNL